jgi:hypothetical protein
MWSDRKTQLGSPLAQACATLMAGVCSFMPSRRLPHTLQRSSSQCCQHLHDGQCQMWTVAFLKTVLPLTTVKPCDSGI